jgi:glutamate--cysteine ligase catalytic subunit
MKGLLKVGVPKSWEASKNDRKYVREAGVRQFISTYNRVKDLQGDALLWGDEIEYGIFKVDHEQKKVRLSLRAKEVRLSFANFVCDNRCCPYLCDSHGTHTIPLFR